MLFLLYINTYALNISQPFCQHSCLELTLLLFNGALAGLALLVCEALDLQVGQTKCANVCRQKLFFKMCGGKIFKTLWSACVKLQ